MRLPERRPFQHLSAAAWLRLALAVNACLLLLFVVGVVQSRGLMSYAANDFRAFRTVAAIARDYGYPSVYDDRLLEAYQAPLVRSFATPLGQAEFVPMPTPFLPAFLPAFLPLLWAPPLVGFLGWTALSICVLVLSFRPSLRNVSRSWRATLMAAAFLSLPVFLTLIFGQVTAWMCLGIAGFLLSMKHGRDLPAGLSLALLLIKPQALLVIAPGLLVARRFRVALGLAAGTAIALLGSFAVSGVEGMTRLLSLYVRYPGDLPYTFPESMMNWRALATQVNQVLLAGEIIDWVAILAALATVGLGLVLWSRPGATRDPVRLAAVVAGSYAAAALAGWHAHVHMAAPMLVALLWLWETPPWRSYLVVWVLVPTFLFTLTGIAIGPGAAHRVAAVLLVMLNAIALWFAWRFTARYRPKVEVPSQRNAA